MCWRQWCSGGQLLMAEALALLPSWAGRSVQSEGDVLEAVVFWWAVAAFVWLLVVRLGRLWAELDWSSLLTVTLCLAIGIVFIYVGATDMLEQFLLKTYGLPSEATVINTSTDVDEYGVVSYELQYRYLPPSASDSLVPVIPGFSSPVWYFGSQTVSEDLFAKVRVGSRIVITFLPSDPTVSAIEPREDGSMLLFLGIVLILVSDHVFA
eukprot:TRINITY_DN14603_c0_g1_i1.p1 TRINITY_DN14603_c0_g1~~TRINITY_DN14603_c0_g1_i1.p1  ORF type:complete len:209 (-),score=33.29 TRINITY_DN14603_c0_g1_i1:77-703(-)